MFRNFYPWEYSKSVFDIDYKKLYRQGYRGIIFDVDNTLVHHGDDSTPEVDQLFRTLHEIGFKTFLLTDNNEERVKRFIRNIDTQYLCEAGKPDPSCYRKALEALNMDRSQVVCNRRSDISGYSRSQPSGDRQYPGTFYQASFRDEDRQTPAAGKSHTLVLST